MKPSQKPLPDSTGKTDFSSFNQTRSSIGSLNSITITFADERSSPVADSTSFRSGTDFASSSTFTTRGTTSAG